MMMQATTSISTENDVLVSEHTRRRFSAFEQHYIGVRNKESRILSVEDIRKLPYPDASDKNHAEWKLRQKSIKRLVHYINNKPTTLRILDIGCGNGFMTNLLAGKINRAVGVDVNLTELKQAAQAFPDARITWYCLDLLNEVLPEDPFDIITFGASFQYFKDPAQILAVCRKLLAPQGEIHIIDSPFYSDEEKSRAQQNSRNYFQAMQAEAMTEHYHHHSFNALKEFEIEWKYRPGSFVHKLFRITDSPFPWIKIS
jgi:ubiquinone/menaquinone biosynthesis C-methylase UbiE